MEYPQTLGEARGNPLQCVMGDSLQEGGAADVSGADGDAVEAREDFGVCLGQLLIATLYVPRTLACTEGVIIPNSFRKNTDRREAK